MMNKRYERNHFKAFSNSINKKKLYKKGKEWVVGSLTLLALAGLGITVNHSVHADGDTNTKAAITNVSGTANIEHKSKVMYNGIIAHGMANSSANQLTRKDSAKAHVVNNTESNKTSASNSVSNINNSSSANTASSSKAQGSRVNESNSSNGSNHTVGLTLSTPNLTEPNVTSTKNTTSVNNQSQQLSDLNSDYHYNFPYQPQGQDQVDQMNFVYLLNGQPMSISDIPKITHTRTKSSDYNLSTYNITNPYKLFNGTKLYGYNVIAHGGTPFSSDFDRYMPKYLNGLKLIKPSFPLNTPQVTIWNSKEIGKDFKGAGTNGITYYLNYIPAGNKIVYHIDTRPSVVALSDMSNGQNGNMNSDYDHNMSDFVKNAKNGNWANLPYSDVKVGYKDGQLNQPVYKKMQDVVVKHDINNRGYSDVFKQIGNNYQYGQSDLESYIPRQYTFDAEPMASITIHFLYNGKDVAAPIVKTGVEHQPFNISQYSDDLPEGYRYINNTIENSTLSDANPKYFDEPCDVVAFGTYINGAGKNAGQYSNNKDVNVILTKDNTDTVNYSYDGKILPEPYQWSATGDVNESDYLAEAIFNNLSRLASDTNAAKYYASMASNDNYPAHQGFTINPSDASRVAKSLMKDQYNPKNYGQIHQTIPLRKVYNSVQYVNADNGEQVGNTWIHRLTSDMNSDEDSDIQPLGKMLSRISINNSASDSDYNQLEQTYNYPSNYKLDFSQNLKFNLPTIAHTAQEIPTYQRYIRSDGYWVINTAPKPYHFGKYHLIIPVVPNNPATHTLEYVNGNNVISRYQQTGTDNAIDSDINTNFVDTHVPQYYQIDRTKPQPNVNNLHYDNGITKIPVKQLTTRITVKYVNLDDVYNPYGRNNPNTKYVDYYGELGSDTVTNNLQKPFIPFNVLNYDGTNYENSDAIKDIAHVNNYQYSQMVSDNNVHQFSDKPQTIIIGLQKVSDNGITYTYNGQPIAGWTSKSKGSTNTSDQEIVNLHNTITPFSAPNLPKGFVIPVSSDGNGQSDYSKFTSDDNPLEPNNVNYYHYGQHYMIPVEKAEHTITVNFVNDENNQFIQKAGSDTEKAGTPFSVAQYTHNLPSSDYYYVGVRNNRRDFGTKDYTVDVLLKKYKGTINVNYIDETDHNKVMKTFPPTTEEVGTPFSNQSYLRNLPLGYKFDKMTGNISKYIRGEHTVDIYLNKESNITVNYIDANTNHLIKKAGSDTNIVGAPFNVGPYEASNVLPKGYTFDKVNNNTNRYNINNQTVDILLSRKANKESSNANNSVNPSSSSVVPPVTPSIPSTPSQASSSSASSSVPSRRNAGAVVKSSTSDVAPSYMKPAHQRVITKKNAKNLMNQLNKLIHKDHGLTHHQAKLYRKLIGKHHEGIARRRARGTSVRTSVVKRNQGYVRRTIGKQHGRSAVVRRQLKLRKITSARVQRQRKNAKKLPQTGEVQSYLALYAMLFVLSTVILADLGKAIDSRRHE